MATTDERHETESGIEVKPVYTADDSAGRELELPGEFPITRGPYPPTRASCRGAATS